LRIRRAIGAGSDATFPSKIRVPSLSRMQTLVSPVARKLAVILYRIWTDGTEFWWTKEAATARIGPGRQRHATGMAGDGLKAAMQKAGVVKNKAELVVLAANAHFGEEIKLIPKANKHQLWRTRRREVGRAAHQASARRC
jgi:hypothetical protein